MELEIYDALMAAGVPADKAKIAVESIDKAIDRRYALHHDQLTQSPDLPACSPRGVTFRRAAEVRT